MSPGLYNPPGPMQLTHWVSGGGGGNHQPLEASQVALVVKNPPANAGDTGDVGSIPGSGRFPEEGDGNPFQYFCLGNPMTGTWQATVHEVGKSQTHMHAQGPLRSGSLT